MKIKVKNNILIALAISAFGLAGCASNSPSETKAPVAKQEASSSSKSAIAEKKRVEAPAAGPTITAATGNNGTVVFFREGKFMGAAISFMVREDGVELGKISSGSYFAVDLPVGPHKFEVHTEAKDILNLEVAPGQVYYVQGTISMGAFVGHPHLEPSDAGTFDSMKAKLKLSPPPKPAKK